MCSKHTVRALWSRSTIRHLMALQIGKRDLESFELTGPSTACGVRETRRGVTKVSRSCAGLYWCACRTVSDGSHPLRALSKCLSFATS